MPLDLYGHWYIKFMHVANGYIPTSVAPAYAHSMLHVLGQQHIITTIALFYTLTRAVAEVHMMK